MIGSVLATAVACFAVGGILMAFAGRKVAPPVRRQRWRKYATYVVIIFGMLCAAALGRLWLLALAVAIIAIGGGELAHALRRVYARTPRMVPSIVAIYTLLALLFLFFVATSPPTAVAYVYLTVAAFDGFSQVTGQLVGHRLLFPSISPAKTVEGLAGGVLAALVIAILLRSFSGLSVPIALAVGAAVAVCGVAGDLAGSWLKRRANIKDYSQLVPAHGGVLDRFGSFIVAGSLVGIPLSVLPASAG